MKLTRDVKNVLKSMIEKKLKALTKVDGSGDEGAIQRQIDGIVALIKKDPLKILDIEDIKKDGGFNEDLGWDGLNLSASFIKEANKIIAANPTASTLESNQMGDHEDQIEFPALEFRLYNVPKKFRPRFQKLADKIDLSVVTAEGKDLYEMINGA